MTGGKLALGIEFFVDLDFLLDLLQSWGDRSLFVELECGIVQFARLALQLLALLGGYSLGGILSMRPW